VEDRAFNGRETALGVTVRNFHKKGQTDSSTCPTWRRSVLHFKWDLGEVERRSKMEEKTGRGEELAQTQLAGGQRPDSQNRQKTFKAPGSV